MYSEFLCQNWKSKPVSQALCWCLGLPDSIRNILWRRNESYPHYWVVHILWSHDRLWGQNKDNIHFPIQASHMRAPHINDNKIQSSSMCSKGVIGLCCENHDRIAVKVKVIAQNHYSVTCSRLETERDVFQIPLATNSL